MGVEASPMAFEASPMTVEASPMAVQAAPIAVQASPIAGEAAIRRNSMKFDEIRCFGSVWKTSGRIREAFGGILEASWGPLGLPLGHRGAQISIFIDLLSIWGTSWGAFWSDFGDFSVNWAT